MNEMFDAFTDINKIISDDVSFWITGRSIIGTFFFEGRVTINSERFMGRLTDFLDPEWKQKYLASAWRSHVSFFKWEHARDKRDMFSQKFISRRDDIFWTPIWAQRASFYGDTLKVGYIPIIRRCCFSWS